MTDVQNVKIMVGDRGNRRQHHDLDNDDEGRQRHASDRRAAFHQEALEKEERVVMRECLYVLQGISGERIKFVPTAASFVADAMSSESEGANTIRLSSFALRNGDLPPDCVKTSQLGSSSGARDALHICGEAGWLYNKIQSYKATGSVSRAFGCAVALELESYQRFLAKLEVDDSITCLRDIVAAVQQPLARLKILAIISDNDLQGADLLTHLHRHCANHGETKHVALVQKLLKAASQPWFQLLYMWTIEGRLQDPAHEFFVTTNDTLNDTQPAKQTDRDLWREGYHLDRSKVPVGILDEHLIDLVFVVGKGVNYIRTCLDDGEWSLLKELEKIDSKSSIDDVTCSDQVRQRTKLGFCYVVSPTTTSLQPHALRSTLERSATLVHSHILQSLKKEHGLMPNLFALKQFLLLGQGDFFSALMDGIQSEYEHHTGVVGVYRHTLTAVVESSVRSTNASGFSKDILERLEVELLLDKDDNARYMFAPSRTTKNDSDGRTVWDIFLLQYTVPDPLVAVINPAAMDMYNRMFVFLFGLKKVEFLLNFTWRQSSSLQRALHSNAQYLVIKISCNREYAQAIILLRQVAMLRQAMMHFVFNLKSYLMFEVLEGSWKKLVSSIDAAQTLDEVIKAHDNYLDGIFRKSLFRDGEARDDIDLACKLESLLRLVRDFCSYQKELFEEALEAADRAAEKRREAELLVNKGSWGIRTQREVMEQETCFGLSDTTKFEDLEYLSQEFNNQMLSLLRALDSKINGRPAWEVDHTTGTAVTPSSARANVAMDTLEMDEDQDDDLDSLRFLASQLDHNEFYGVSNF